MTVQQIRQKARKMGLKKHHPVQEGTPDPSHPGTRGELAVLQGHTRLLGSRVPLERRNVRADRLGIASPSVQRVLLVRPKNPRRI